MITHQLLVTGIMVSKNMIPTVLMVESHFPNGTLKRIPWGSNPKVS
jgi:hypothetical protein